MADSDELLLGSLSDAEREMTRSLRAQISERERNRQQVALLSGGTLAVAASVMTQASISNLLVLGLAVLLLAFAFMMLNLDYRAAVAATFIVDLGGDDAAIQRAWERHLHIESRMPRPFMVRISRWVRVSASYAVPVFGALGVLGVFLRNAAGIELGAALLPAMLAVFFAVAARDLIQRYAVLAG